MKIERSVKCFEPVTITIETLDEFKFFYALSNQSASSILKSAESVTNLAEFDCMISEEYAESAVIGLYSNLSKVAHVIKHTA